MDFAVGLVDLIPHLLEGQVKVLGEFFCTSLQKNFFGLVKMASGLVHPGYRTSWKIEFLCTLNLDSGLD